MGQQADVLRDVEARLGLADSILTDDEAWVVCRPVRDADGTVRDFEYLLANDAAERSVDLGPLAGRHMVALVPEAREGAFVVFRQALADGRRHRSVSSAIVREGHGWTPGWTGLDVRCVGELVVAHWWDATVEHENAVAAERSEARLRALLVNAGEVISLYSGDGRTLLYQSPSAVRVLGRQGPEGILDRIHPDDVDRAREALGRLIGGGAGAVVEADVRLEHADGRWVWVHARGTNYVDDPDVGGLVINYWDVTEQREMADQLRWQALHDPLTGLANRRLIDAELEQALADLDRSSGCVGLVLCDVDYFKSVNDALGHPAGDDLLVAVSGRLRQLVRPSDTIGRLGGDEFVIICRDLHRRDELSTVIERLQTHLRGVYRLDDQDLHVTVTVGASCASVPLTPSELLGEADTALYVAKRAGRDRIQIFDRRVHRGARDRATRRQALRQGIDRGELVLHYQPKVDLATGAVVAAEALVRWQHPTDGLLQANDFLPLAEESLLIVDIGEWVLREAMREASRWPALRDPSTGRTHPTMNINVSGRHLSHPALLDHLDAALADSGLDPTRVELEITETLLLQDLEQAGRILQAVRARGIGIALDDFGTGYSSLTWLQRLPVDTVKLDRSFIADLLSQGGYATDILGGVTRLAHAMGKEVVAEGVETREQHDFLVEIGCDFGQGFLYGRPVPESPFAPAGG